MVCCEAKDTTAFEAMDMFMHGPAAMDVDQGCLYLMAPARTLKPLIARFCKRHEAVTLSHAAVKATLRGRRIELQPKIDLGA